MYREYFGFRDEPFSIAPDPRYLYLSPRHDEALAHLVFGLQNAGGGFVLLTGEVGTGKTTVCRCALECVPEDCDIAFIYNPKLTIPELLSTVCDELRIPGPSASGGTKAFVDAINRRLVESHRQGRRTVLMIDEAQNLEADVLEQLRLLTNLETSERKLLQIILIGQPELLDRLARPELRQLAQRIVARYHLTHLSPGELASYVQHRLAVAGVRRRLFPEPVLRRLYRHTGGIPRLVNAICDRALLGTYLHGLESVDRLVLEQAVREVMGPPARGVWPVVRGWREWRAALFGPGLAPAVYAGGAAAGKPLSWKGGR
ncbi:MAG: peptidoglycan-binding domain 1 [Rhodocyclaceae bacterium]|nr:peptidoglycan-binding domain 1 [Rhodocyclaceae bacterium]